MCYIKILIPSDQDSQGATAPPHIVYMVRCNPHASRRIVLTRVLTGTKKTNMCAYLFSRVQVLFVKSGSYGGEFSVSIVSTGLSQYLMSLR